MTKILEKIKNLKIFSVFKLYHRFFNRFEWFRKTKSFSKHYFMGIYNRIDDHHVFLLGGSLSFSIFVCIIPFILIIFSILGAYLDSTNIQYEINTIIDTMIPYSQYSDHVKKIIFSRVDEVIEYKTAAGIVGAFGLLFAASGLFSSMRTILNKVLGEEKEGSIFITKLLDFALVVFVIILFFLFNLILPVIDAGRQVVSSWDILKFLQFSFIEYIVYTAISLFLIFSIFWIMYFFVPTKRVGRKPLVISAIWAAIMWEAAKQIFGVYLHNYSSFGKIYGAYSLVVVVAFWIYYSSIVFILGAMIGRLYYERNHLPEEEKKVIKQ